MHQRNLSIVLDPEPGPDSSKKGKNRKDKGQPGWLGFFRKLFWSWWVWIVVAVAGALGDHGNLALVLAGVGFVFYLLASRERIPGYGLESKFSIESREFLTSIVGGTGVPFIPNNRVTLLNNGEEFYSAMLEAAAHAKRTITIETYIFWDGEIGRRFADVLANRCREGVRVKILLDAFGSSCIGKEILATLKEGGCEVAWYNRAWLRTIGRFNHRTHRKSVIVDGSTAFTGGAGIADQWKGRARGPAEWRDMQICIEGPGAIGLQSAFAQNWLEMTGEIISGAGYFPPPESRGATATQTILSSPKSGASSIRIMYYLSIISARKTLYIANAYFVPDDSAVRILLEAKRRGVDVKIMVAGIHNDMRISRYASIHGYGELLEGGIEIYEYNRTMLHHKTMVADGIWVTVGTTNFDNRSFGLDEESNVCVYDRRLAAQLEASFMDDLKYCDRVSLEEWRRRGLKPRVFGAVCALLKEQI